MGKVYLSQFNFNNYAGARTIGVSSGSIAPMYLEELSLENSNNIYLSMISNYNYLISTNDAEDNIYMNSNLSGMCKDLTMLTSTDLLNKHIVNYHEVSNMHTMFANCYSLTGHPVSAKNVLSMYGTYYNCGALTGSAAVNGNVDNLIGAYYNCKKISSVPETIENAKMLIDTFYNCTKITGEPADSDLAISMQNAYYNCWRLQGNPANCNNAIITTNAYYNCKNLYGDFYWQVNDFDQAEKINAVNMFYNRNCDNQLNIHIKYNSAIMNGLLNYSGSFGNIYGIGAIDWSHATNDESDLYGYYYNELYNTNLLFDFTPLILRQSLGIDENFNISSGYIYPQQGSSFYYININSSTILNFLSNEDELPEGYTLLRQQDGINIYQNINSFTVTHDKYYGGDGYTVNKVVSVNNITYIIGLNNHSHDELVFMNYIFSNIKNSITLKEKLNNFHYLDYLDYFSCNSIENLQDLSNRRCYRYSNYAYMPKTSKIYATCPENAKNIQNLYYSFFQSNGPKTFMGILYNSDYASPMKRGLIENIYFDYLQDYSLELDTFYGCTADYITELVPICPNNVIYMGYAYYNTKVKKAVFGLNVLQADYAYSSCPIEENGYSFPPNLYTGVGLYYNSSNNIWGWFNEQEIQIPETTLELSECFKNSLHIVNIQNLHATLNLRYQNNLFYNCSNLLYTFNSSNFQNYRIYSASNSYGYMGKYQECKNLVYCEEGFLNGVINYVNMFKNCSNLVYLKYNYIPSIGSSYWEADSMFHNCVNLKGTISIGNAYLAGYLDRMFYNCGNIEGIIINNGYGCGTRDYFFGLNNLLILRITNNSTSANFKFELPCLNLYDVNLNHDGSLKFANVFPNLTYINAGSINFTNKSDFSNLSYIDANHNIVFNIGYNDYSSTNMINLKTLICNDLKINTNFLENTTINFYSLNNFRSNNIYLTSLGNKTAFYQYQILMPNVNCLNSNSLQLSTYFSNFYINLINIEYLTNNSWINFKEYSKIEEYINYTNIFLTDFYLPNLKDISTEHYLLNLVNYCENTFIVEDFNNYKKYNYNIPNCTFANLIGLNLKFDPLVFQTRLIDGYFNQTIPNLKFLQIFGFNFNNYLNEKDNTNHFSIKIFNNIIQQPLNVEQIAIKNFLLYDIHRNYKTFLTSINSVNDLYITSDSLLGCDYSSIQDNEENIYNFLIYNHINNFITLEEITEMLNYNSITLKLTDDIFSFYLLNRINKTLIPADITTLEFSYNLYNYHLGEYHYSISTNRLLGFLSRFDTYKNIITLDFINKFGNIYGENLVQNLFFSKNNDFTMDFMGTLFNYDNDFIFPNNKENFIFNLQNFLCNNVNNVHIDFSLPTMYEFNKVSQTLDIKSNLFNNIAELTKLSPLCEFDYDGYYSHSMHPNFKVVKRRTHSNIDHTTGPNEISLFVGYLEKYNSTDFLGTNLIFDSESNTQILYWYWYWYHANNNTYRFYNVPVQQDGYWYGYNDYNYNYFYIEKENLLYNVKISYIISTPNTQNP